MDRLPAGRPCARGFCCFRLDGGVQTRGKRVLVEALDRVEITAFGHAGASACRYQASGPLCRLSGQFQRVHHPHHFHSLSAVVRERHHEGFIRRYRVATPARDERRIRVGALPARSRSSHWAKSVGCVAAPSCINVTEWARARWRDRPRCARQQSQPAVGRAEFVQVRTSFEGESQVTAIAELALWARSFAGHFIELQRIIGLNAQRGRSQQLRSDSGVGGMAAVEPSARGSRTGKRRVAHLSFRAGFVVRPEASNCCE